MQKLLLWLTCLALALSVAACGDGAEAPPNQGPLGGDPAARALSALVNLGPEPAAAADIVGGLILTRLDVAIAADATVGQINTAIESIGGRIVAMRAGVPALTVAVPRRNDAVALKALADSLQAQPGIRLVLLAREASLNVAPPAPADSQANFGYLQMAKFPAAWNARTAQRGLCVNDKVTVIVADKFHRPMDALLGSFTTQVPVVAQIGTGSVPAAALAGFHGYDVLATLAAGLDAEPPTGANPFNDCLELKALQIDGLSPYDIIFAIDTAVAASAGKVVLNTSFGFSDLCGDLATGTPCVPETLSLPNALERAAWGAMQRALLQPVADRLLVTTSAGNDAADPVTTLYPGAGLARVGSALNVAATADAAMSFTTDAALWTPAAPCASPPCFPSLAATPPEVATLGALLVDLAQTEAPPAANVMIVGSIDTFFVASSFSEPGANVFAVGEAIPTLIGIPTQGTSFAAPQVAALASYLWMLSPELRARPAADTLAAIKANADADGIINAYASVLSLDEPAAVTPATARVRLAILDADADGDFDLADLQAFHAAYVSAGAMREPTVQDFSRFDLTGDGFTGGARATRMDLDPTGSTRFGAPLLSEVPVEFGGTTLAINEIAITDARALCFYALSALYTGTDLEARDALLSDLCPTVTVSVAPGSVTLAPGASQAFQAVVLRAADTNVSWTTTGGTINAAGLYVSGTATGSFRVRGTSVADPSAFAEASVTIAPSNGAITSINRPTFIGACAAADLQVFTTGFANPQVTFNVQGDARLSNQTLIATTTFTTWVASRSATGQIVVTATSVENPSVSASATLRVDPFVAAYGSPSGTRAFVARGADAGLPDATYRVAVHIEASPAIDRVFSATFGANGLSGALANGDSISVVIDANEMRGTVRVGGVTMPITLSHNCAP